MIAQQNAIVESIRQKDTSLAELMENLFANEFNLARIPQKQQQFYLDRFQEARSESKEMKVFDDIFTKAGVDVSDRKDLMKQIFDLSKNELSIK